MKQIALESFQWAQQLYPILKQFEVDGVSFYKVEANHADIKNQNGRVYTSKELSSAASSLSERPLNINHDSKRTLPFPENQVVAARYEGGVVECIIQVADPQVNQMISSGDIAKVSVEGLYLDESNNTGNTEYPTSLHFRALALLTKDDQPGDPLTRIFKESRAVFEEIPISKVNTLQRTKEDEWSNSFVNDLPDSSFAAIETGGKKDEEGKTVPRSLRHLPYKDANGKPDAAHVNNALARLSQTQISAQLKGAARQKLVAAAKQLGINTSMDEAFKTFKIAKEILRACLEQDDADDDQIVQAPLGMGSQSQQTNYSSGGSMPETDTSPNTVPTGEMPTQPVPSGNAPNGGSPSSAPNIPPQNAGPQDFGSAPQVNAAPSQVPSGEMPATIIPDSKPPGGDPHQSNAPDVPSQDGGSQTNYTMDQAVKLQPQTVPGGTTSQIEALAGPPVTHTPEMDPAKMNPDLLMSPGGITSQHRMDLQAQNIDGGSPTATSGQPQMAYEAFRFKGRKVRLAISK